MQYLRALRQMLPTPLEQPVFDNATCDLPASHCISSTSQSVSGDVVIRTADINKKTSICLVISETDVRRIGTDLPSSRDGSIPHHSDVIRLRKPTRMMPVPSALHWNPKMMTNIPVDNGGHLIVSISVVHRCQGTTACHNVVNCFQAYTAQAASRTDISMQNVALIKNTKSEELGLEQQQRVPQLQQDNLMTSAICRSLSCPQVVSP